MFKLEEKSEALTLFLFELQNCVLSLDAISGTVNKMYNSSYRLVTHMILESEMLQLHRSLMGRYISYLKVWYAYLHVSIDI